MPQRFHWQAGPWQGHPGAAQCVAQPGGPVYTSIYLSLSMTYHRARPHGNTPRCGHQPWVPTPYAWRHLCSLAVQEHMYIYIHCPLPNMESPPRMRDGPRSGREERSPNGIHPTSSGHHARGTKQDACTATPLWLEERVSSAPWTLGASDPSLPMGDFAGGGGGCPDISHVTMLPCAMNCALDVGHSQEAKHRAQY